MDHEDLSDAELIESTTFIKSLCHRLQFFHQQIFICFLLAYVVMAFVGGSIKRIINLILTVVKNSI